MRYLIPYTVLRRDLHDSGLNDEQVVAIIRKLLVAVPMDEEWYLKTYPDVAAAIDSPKRHFIYHGYFEGRLPFEHEIDEEWYLKTYPDVAERCKDEGDIQSAKQHYSVHGYSEGRLPGPMIRSLV